MHGRSTPSVPSNARPVWMPGLARGASRRRCATTIGLLMALGSVGAGQTGIGLRSAVRDYRATPASAVHLIAAGEVDVLRREVRECADKFCSRRDMLTAVMLLTDAADLVFARDERKARSLVGEAAHLAERLRRETGGALAVESQFLPRWHAHAAYLLLTHGFVSDARSTIDDALERYPQSVELRVAQGVMFEIPIYWQNDNVRGREVTSNPPAGRPPTMWFGGGVHGARLQAALNEYERALRLSEHDAWAQLRRAWVRVVLHDSRAETDLAAVLEHASDDDVRYLAHLLRAGLAERAGQVEETVVAYQRATSFGPFYKTACIGLSRAYTFSGQVDEATAVSTRCLRLSGERDLTDPWLVLRLGTTPPAMLDQLRREARDE